MKYSSALLALVVASASVHAQQPDPTAYGAGLFMTLNTAGLTSLAQAATGAATQLLPALFGGNKTILAPTNDAYAAIASANLSPEILLATLQYHLINSAVNVGDIDDSRPTIATSSLVGDQYVQLPNGRPQAIVFRKYDNKTVYVAEASRNVSFVNATDGPQYQNLRIQPITQVLRIPGNLSSVAADIGATALTTALTQLNLLAALQSSRTGLTIFAPNDAAFAAAASGLVQAGPEQVSNVLHTHILNGTVAYSSLLTGRGAPTTRVAASGNTLTFGTQNGAMTVSSGSATARIIRTDVLASNAVVHVIDAVLANPASNPAAADAAFNAAVAANANQAPPGGAGAGGAGAAAGAAAGGGGAAAGGADKKNSAFKLNTGSAAVIGLSIAAAAALLL